MAVFISSKRGSGSTTGNMDPIASSDTDEVEITYSCTHDRPRSYDSEPRNCSRNQEQARMRKK